MTGPKHIPPRDEGFERRVLAAYAEGVELAAIGKRFRLCPMTVTKMAREAGVERPQRVRLTRRSKRRAAR